MNVLFVEENLRTDKLGFLYISAVLKKAGHNVDLLIGNLWQINNYLAQNKVDFVMCSVMTAEAKWYFDTVSELKKKHNFKSVFGGAHFTFYPETEKDNPDVDHILIGPGEHVIVDIVEGRIKDKIIKGIIPDLSKPIHPDRSILYKYDKFGKAPIKRFISCRDCPYSCKFCGSKRYREVFKDQKHMFNQRVPVDFFIEEIKQVSDKYPPLKVIHFNDDNFAGNREWLKEFCSKYDLGIAWGCEVRPESVTKELLQMMKDAGCDSLFIGLEAVRPETLKIMGRTSKPEKVKQICEWAKEIGIRRVQVENMIGLPVEDSLEDALDTLEFNLSLPNIHSWVATYQPFPGTELWQYCLDNSFLDDGEARFPKFEERSMLNIKDKEKLFRLHKWWFFIVRNKLPIKVAKQLIDLPMSEELAKALWDYRLKCASKELYS